MLMHLKGVDGADVMFDTNTMLTWSFYEDRIEVWGSPKRFPSPFDEPELLQSIPNYVELENENT